MAAKKFMEESYNMMGGCNKQYYKDINLNFEELDNLQKFSELELAKNATNPEKSKFLREPVEDRTYNKDENMLDSRMMNSRAQNGQRVLNDSLVFNRSKSDINLELSREVTRYIAFRKMEKSRQEEHRSMIASAVSMLDESENPPPVEVKDVLQNVNQVLAKHQAMIEGRPYEDESETQKVLSKNSSVKDSSKPLDKKALEKEKKKREKEEKERKAKEKKEKEKQEKERKEREKKEKKEREKKEKERKEREKKEKKEKSKEKKKK